MYGSLTPSPLADGGVPPTSAPSLPSTACPPEVECHVPTSGRANAFSCTINLANTIVGAGMLGLPGAFGGTGWGGGVLLLLGAAAFSAHGLVLLSASSMRTGTPSSFYRVAQAAVPGYTLLIDGAVAAKCFGVATGYLITVGDCMVEAFALILRGEEDAWWVQALLSRRFWVTGGFLLVLPTSFYRTLDDLKKTSALALVFVFLLAAGIVAYAHGMADPCEGYTESCRGDVEPFTDLASTISKMPIFVFAFTCHQNIFPVVNEIRGQTQRRINLVVAAAVLFSLLVYMPVAIEGYRTYGSNVKGDILLNYPETGKVTLLRICIAFMLTLHYPLQLDPSRRCIMSLLSVVQAWIQKKKCTASLQEDLVDRTEDMSMLKEGCKNLDDADDRLFYMVTFSFLLLSLLVALCVDDLGVVLALVGATGSTLVTYVLPGLIYIKVFPSMDVAKGFAYLQLILGCIIMPVALYFVLGGKLSE
mmetsp:Transcript_9909/g.22116  ORF Transcript_9909/g.22116 Transcript_9909/m.22116 type:complete len:475 (-) Transcript_9909:218-1642(-)